MISSTKTILAIVVLVIVIILITIGRSQSAVEMDAAQYCQMVHNKAWPDFHHVYRQECHHDGSINKEYIYGR